MTSAVLRQKNGGGFMCEKQLFLRFCKSLIFKYSHRTQGLRQKIEF